MTPSDLLKTTLKYLFDFKPQNDASFLVVLVIIFAAASLSSILIKKQLKKNKNNPALMRLFKRLPSQIQIISGIGLILLLGRIFLIPFITFRGLIITLVILIIIIAFKAFLIFKRHLPHEIAKHQNYLEKNLYLPRKKKK